MAAEKAQMEEVMADWRPVLLLLLMHGQRLVPDVEWWGWWLENWSTYSKLTMRICWHRHLHSLRLETKSWLRSWSKRLSSLSTSIWESLELSVHHLLLLLLSKEELLLLEMILVHHGLVLHHSLLFLVWQRGSLLLNLFILFFHLFNSWSWSCGSHRFKIFDTKCSFWCFQSDVVHVKFSHGCVNNVWK